PVLPSSTRSSARTRTSSTVRASSRSCSSDLPGSRSRMCTPHELSAQARLTAMGSVRGADIVISDEGEGLPFFWGHGLVSSMEQEDRFLVMDWARLARRYRVIRWDARGHGLSSGAPVPDDYRWDNLARDLIALADELGIDQFVAGGASMGAATALHAAIQAPERVLGLVLMLAPTAYETRDEQADLYRAAAVLVERIGKESYL